MPSPICSCITAGFGVKSLRRHRSMPHGLLSPVGHPGYKNDRGERVSSKTDDRSICTVGPPSAKAGGTLPTMRRHNTCQAKKTFTPQYEIRHPSPKAHKKQPPHPAYPRIVMASVHGKKRTSMTALLPWKVQANSQARHPVPRRSTSPAVRCPTEGTPSFNSGIPAHTFYRRRRTP